jgi:hypothetical protein
MSFSGPLCILLSSILTRDSLPSVNPAIASGDLSTASGPQGTFADDVWFVSSLGATSVSLCGIYQTCMRDEFEKPL